MAMGFSSGQIKISHSADLLITNFAHWSVYLISIAFFLVFTCVTVLRYRQTMNHLNIELRGERDKLQVLISQMRVLSGLMPICAKCKKIRDDKGYWN